MKDLKLPRQIDVRIKKSKNVFIAEIPQYSIFTEADSYNELISMINDLIYCYFDVPENLQNKFQYKPDENDYAKVKPFIIFSSPDFIKKHIVS